MDYKNIICEFIKEFIGDYLNSWNEIYINPITFEFQKRISNNSGIIEFVFTQDGKDLFRNMVLLIPFMDLGTQEFSDKQVDRYNGWEPDISSYKTMLENIIGFALKDKIDNLYKYRKSDMKDISNAIQDYLKENENL